MIGKIQLDSNQQGRILSNCDYLLLIPSQNISEDYIFHSKRVVLNQTANLIKTFLFSSAKTKQRFQKIRMTRTTNKKRLDISLSLSKEGTFGQLKGNEIPGFILGWKFETWTSHVQLEEKKTDFGQPGHLVITDVIFYDLNY